MVELETIIGLATIPYIVETNLYKLHPMDEKNSSILSTINKYILLRVL